MPLILAIESDRRQAAQLSAAIERRVDAELILVNTTERALDAIGNRMPDLVLVPAFLSPQDDAALAAALRVIAAAAHVQMLTIPVLGSAKPVQKAGGVLSALRRGKQRAAEPEGCDPAVFAEQIASYLERAEEERVVPAPDVDGPPAVMPDPPVGTRPESIEPFEEFGGEPAESMTVMEEAGVEVESPVAERNRAEREEPDPAPPEVTSPTIAEPEVVPEAEIFAAIATEPEILPEPEAVSEPEVLAAPETVAEPEVIAASEIAYESEIEEPVAVTSADESVSWALEEAVRALFSDSDQEVQPVQDAQNVPEVQELGAAPEIFESGEVPEIEAEQHVAHVQQMQPVQKDEWESLEQLMAALDSMPLAAIEATDESEWIAPAAVEPERPVQKVQAAPKEVPPDAQPAPVPAKSEREWVALIESLRHDVERLRSERAEKPAKKAASQKTTRSEAARSETARSAGSKKEAKEAARSERKTKPVQDEWGFFDPEQCGFAALLAKLDEVTDSEEGSADPDQPGRSD